MDDRHLPKLRLAQIAIKALLVDETIVYYPDLEEHYGELKDALINAGHELRLVIRDLEQQAAHSRGEGMN